MKYFSKMREPGIIVFFVISSFLLFLVLPAHADTHTAASPSFADVSAAVSAAHSGDIVIIPAGSATWDSQLVITKGIYLKGAGIIHTVITSNYSPSIYRLNPDSFLMVYNPSDPEKNEPFRLSGFTFDCDSKCLPVFLRNSSSSPITKVRIDHIKTVNPQGGRLTIALHGAIWGVADNNIFDGSYTSVDGYDNEWSVRAFNFGTGDMFYFEDNTFVGRESLVIRSEQGARWCARYNTFDGQYMTGGTYPWFDMHGNQPNAWHAVMGVEVYGNIINLPSGYGCTAIDQRGGKLLYYNNTLNVQLSYIQSREEYNDNLNPPANNLVSGQPQHVSDSYYWNNLLNGMTRINTIVNDAVDYGGEKGIVPQENRDFWQQQLNFNGTIGVGVGLLSDRPETCTEGVAYWATDTNTLYKAAATNTWEAYYRPYVYPHPLVGREVSIIGLRRRSLRFSATTETEPTNQSFLIKNDWWGSELVWDIMDDASWLSCTPTSGEGDMIVEVSVDSLGMEPGVYEAAISVLSEDAINSPNTVLVTLTVVQAGTTEGPFGCFDTPVEGASVYGSVAITGWALDDIEVLRVEIKRNPHEQDLPGAIGGDGLVFIGNACFVEGSRPDVEQLYASFPFSYKAGWGYLMLTYGLPNKGNGTYVLHAFAYDAEGHRTWLGQKTIHSDNANSDLPFGAIDTPEQGGMISGAGYVNFGWALTPLPKTIPLDGSTIWVWIDGGVLGHPVYNNYRADIVTAFPEYNNSNGAIGYIYLDTTVLNNGMHSIGWTVEDDAGKTEGIGSRFFVVMNSASEGDAQPMTTSSYHGYQSVNPNVLSFTPSLSLTDILNLPVSFEPVAVRIGYDLMAEPEFLSMNPFGTARVRIDQCGRLELGIDGRLEPIERMLGDKAVSPRRSGQGSKLGARELHRGKRKDLTTRGGLNVLPGDGYWTGCLVVGERLRPLPIGSHLDSETGVFTWQLGPAFYGEYRFVFFREIGLPGYTQIIVNVKPDF